jgi:hypothetical protein
MKSSFSGRQVCLVASRGKGGMLQQNKRADEDSGLDKYTNLERIWLLSLTLRLFLGSKIYPAGL